MGGFLGLLPSPEQCPRHHWPRVRLRLGDGNRTQKHAMAFRCWHSMVTSMHNNRTTLEFDIWLLDCFRNGLCLTYIYCNNIWHAAVVSKPLHCQWQPSQHVFSTPLTCYDACMTIYLMTDFVTWARRQKCREIVRDCWDVWWQIYIYAVKLKSGPIFALFKVKKWSKFLLFLFSKISFSLQKEEDFWKKKKSKKTQQKNTTFKVKKWSN